jgi:hypothetical protein
MLDRHERYLTALCRLLPPSSAQLPRQSFVTQSAKSPLNIIPFDEERDSLCQIPYLREIYLLPPLSRDIYL